MLYKNHVYLYLYCVLHWEIVFSLGLYSAYSVLTVLHYQKLLLIPLAE